MRDAGRQSTDPKGALVDANLLVLYLVGIVNKRKIAQFKRTSNFEISDFDLLSRLIEWFGRLIATPYVLSQVSDLTDLPGNDLIVIRTLLKTLVEKSQEVYDPRRLLVADSLFSRFGLADAAIARVCDRGTLVLTADVDLHLALQKRGADSLNFNHVRPLGWR